MVIGQSVVGGKREEGRRNSRAEGQRAVLRDRLSPPPPSLLPSLPPLEVCRTRVPRRPAFTLIEILLVLGILVALAAVTFSSMFGFRESQALPRVADDFRGLFGDLRIRAMQEGRPYQFAFLPDTSEYRILSPGNDVASAGQPPSPAPPRFDAMDVFGPRLLDDQLKFGRLDAPEPTTSAFVSELASEGWVVFQFEPDGSSDDVAFFLVDPTGSQIVLRVHGRTGRTRVEGPFQPTAAQSLVGGNLR